MIDWRILALGFLGFGFGWGPANAEALIQCPNPIFECIGPGLGGTPPGDPPDPIFRPAYPLEKSGVDFNWSFGVIQNGTITMSSGSPNIAPELSGYLERNRLLIDPNAVYLLSPKSIEQIVVEGDGVLVGGGALTQ